MTDSSQPAQVSTDERGPDLLAACKAQHEAIDRLFAMLIVLTRDHTPDNVFFPSKSGQPWEACQLGNTAIKMAEGR